MDEKKTKIKSKKVAVYIIAAILVVGIAVFAIMMVNSHRCGDKVFWSLDDNGILTIKGEGPMWDYDHFDSPFSTASIQSAVIEDGVATIGRNAFRECQNLKSVTIGNGITRIAKYAFDGCNNIKDVYYSDTKEQWDNIEGIASVFEFENATIHYES